MGDFVTQEECEDRRKDIYSKIEKNSADLVEIKIVCTKTESTLSSLLTIGKAIFGVVASGIVSILILLLTRGL